MWHWQILDVAENSCPLARRVQMAIQSIQRGPSRTNISSQLSSLSWHNPQWPPIVSMVKSRHFSVVYNAVVFSFSCCLVSCPTPQDFLSGSSYSGNLSLRLSRLIIQMSPTQRYPSWPRLLKYLVPAINYHIMSISFLHGYCFYLKVVYLSFPPA